MLRRQEQARLPSQGLGSPGSSGVGGQEFGRTARLPSSLGPVSSPSRGYVQLLRPQNQALATELSSSGCACVSVGVRLPSKPTCSSSRLNDLKNFYRSRKVGHGACGASVRDDGSQVLALCLSLTLLPLRSPALRLRSSNRGDTTVLTWDPPWQGRVGCSLPEDTGVFQAALPQACHVPNLCRARRVPGQAPRVPSRLSPHPEASELFPPCSTSPPEVGARVGSVFSSV